jgi:anti-sigma B factor antagonist
MAQEPGDRGAEALDGGVVDARLEVRREGDRSIIEVAGELDASSGARLRTLVSEVLESSPPTVVLDLSGLTFVDSVGLSVIVAAHNRCEASGVALELHDVSPACRRVLEITRLTDVLVLRP